VAGSPLGIWLNGLVALVLLFLGGSLHPIAYLALGIWLPTPLLLVGWRLGLRPAISLAVAAAVFMFLANPRASFLFEHLGAGELLLMGLILHFLRERDLADGDAVVLTVAALILGIVLIFLGQALVWQMSPLALWQQKAGEMAAALQKLLEGTGMAAQPWQPPGLTPIPWHTLILNILPALLVINTGMVAWANLALARTLTAVWDWGAPEPSLSQWRTPEWLIFVFLAAGFSLLAPSPPVRLVGGNVLLVLGFLYFCQGFAVMAAVFQRFQVPRGLRWVGYLLMFINPLLLFISLLGLLDLWFDFRRRFSPLQS